MDKYTQQLSEMYKRGELSTKENNRLYEEYRKSGLKDSKVLEYIKVSTESKKPENSKVSTKVELSDRELQEQILKTLVLNQSDNKTIKFWVVFWSWFTIITVIIYILVLLLNK